MKSDLALMSLVEVAEAIAAKRVSSLEVTEACLSRIEALQPKLNCFIAWEPEQALKAARRADEALAGGKSLGPLHGVPLAHKDMFYRKGEVASCGSKILRDYQPGYTSTVLERLDAAGAIHLGRLNMSEFALGPTGLNEHFGQCRNPWNLEHISGGSSSGSGAAVAARLVYGALGSDTGGSVRIPSSYCGVVGMKPTQTRVSRHGLMPVSFSLDQAGPLTRTVADNARMLKAIAGADANDSTCAQEPVPDYEADLGRAGKGVRIGVPRNYFNEGMADEVSAAMEQSLEVFRTLGAEVIPVELPGIEDLHELANVIQSTEAAAQHRRWIATRRGDYSEQVVSRIEPGLLIPATRYVEALSLRGTISHRFLSEVFGKVDVLHVATSLNPAPATEEVDVAARPGFREVMHRIARCTRPFNFLGTPALSVPAGLSAKGMPMAFQLVGRPFGEARLYNLGHAYQQATDWHLQVPTP